MSEPVIATTWLGGPGSAGHLDVSPLVDSPVMLLCSLEQLEAFQALAARLWRAGIKGSKVVPARDVPGLMSYWTPLDVECLGDLWRILQHATYITEAPPQPKTARPATVGSVAVAKLPMFERWRAWNFETTGQNKPYMNVSNVKKYLDHHPNDYGDVWLDQYRQQIRYGPWSGENREWTDADDVLLQVTLQTEAGLYVISKAAVHDAILARAEENPLHPYREYRKTLEWDKVERLTEAFIRGWGCPDDEYHRMLAEGFFIQQAMRIMNPGCKADAMVMFEGRTNIGKTSALSIVFGHDNVASPTAQFGTQKFYEEIQGKSVIEIADLHSFKGAALESIKAGVTRTVDRFRPAYGRYAEDFPRQSVFVGTTESSDWNEDPELTARRFPPAECSVIDFEWLRANREQLLAEAWHKASLIPYDTAMAGAYWKLPQDVAVSKQRARVKWDAIDEPIAAYLLVRDKTTVLDVARDALGINDFTKLDPRLQSRITVSLRKANWVRRRTNYGRWWEPGPYAARPKKSEVGF